MTVALGLLGFAVGSFINTVAIRLLAGESIRGRSRCLACGKSLQWFELIPLVSWMVQRGRCRSCQARISLRYPLGELAAGVVFATLSHRFFLFPEVGLSLQGGLLGSEYILVFLELALWLVYAAILLVFFQTDLESKLLPDRLMYPVILLSLAASSASASVEIWDGGWHWLGPYGMLGGWLATSWLGRVGIATATALLFFLISFFSSGRWMGWGDGKLVFFLAMIFGFPEIMLVLVLGFLLGGAVSAYLLLARRVSRRSHIPLGPFLVMGAFAVMFFGQEIASWYFSLFSW